MIALEESLDLFLLLFFISYFSNQFYWFVSVDVKIFLEYSLANF